MVPLPDELNVDIEEARGDLRRLQKDLSDEAYSEILNRLKGLRKREIATAKGSGKREKTGARQMRVNLEGVSIRVFYDIDGRTVVVLAVLKKDSFKIRQATSKLVETRRKAAKARRNT